jgi:uncharacterized membrane protein
LIEAEAAMVGLGAFIGMIVFLSILLAFAIPFLIIWLIVVVVRSLAGGPRPRSPLYDPAVQTLRWRLAQGQITEGEFDQAMYDLGYEKVR